MSMLSKEAGEEGEHTLKRSLGALNLITLGIGAIIGAGIFVLTGQAAALHAGPAVALSFVLAGWICAVLLRYKPQYTWPGLALVLLGIPVYLFWSRQTRSGLQAQEHTKE
jgi:amino acid transporter